MPVVVGSAKPFAPEAQASHRNLWNGALDAVGELLNLVHLAVINYDPIFALLRSWNPFRFLRRRIDRTALLSILPAKLPSIPVSTPAARLQPTGVPAAPPHRL